ncbi:MAG: hypothetical protein KKD01_19795 [Proteobacteria bacterium]|nr:hypothetical protein [Pseudomonadota bacterium]
MSWADNLNILLNTTKMFSDRAQSNRDREAQMVLGKADIESRAKQNNANMWFQGLTGVGEGLAKGIEAGNQRAYDLNKMEAEQGFQAGESEKERQAQLLEATNQRTFDITESGKARKFTEEQNNLNRQAQKERDEFARLGVTYEDHPVYNAFTKETRYFTSTNEGKHELNLQEIDSWIGKGQLEYANLLNGGGDSAEFQEILSRVKALKPELGNIVGGDFFNNDGTPLIPAGMNMTQWWDAVRENDTARNSVRAEVVAILKSFPNATALDTEYYVDLVLNPWAKRETQPEQSTDGTPSKLSVGKGAQAGARVVDAVYNWDGIAGFNPFRSLLEILNLKDSSDSINKYIGALPSYVDKESSVEQSLYNLSKIAEKTLNEKLPTATAEEKTDIQTKLGWIKQYPLSWVEKFDFSKIKYNKPDTDKVFNILQDYIDMYKD